MQIQGKIVASTKILCHILSKDNRQRLKFPSSNLNYNKKIDNFVKLSLLFSYF